MQNISKIIGITALLIVLFLALMFALSQQNKEFDLPIQAHAGQNFISTNAALLQHELDDTAGWIVNDIIPPFVLLDNKQNFQLGMLETVRFSIRSLRDSLSRQRTTDLIDTDVKAAFEFVNNDPNKLWFPSFESRMEKSISSLQSYGARLKLGQAQFFPRADNLNQILYEYSSLLGAVTTSMDDDELTFLETDNRFYYAKGVAYSMHMEMLAIQRDFAEVIDKNDAQLLIKDITQLLQASCFEPFVITAGEKDSLRANHLMNISSSLFNARQKINSLISVIGHQGRPSGG
ncbi:MAG: DUF2333 family protein [Mariprofundales bacterium]